MFDLFLIVIAKIGLFLVIGMGNMLIFDDLTIK
jgi:hypothetical protein